MILEIRPSCPGPPGSQIDSKAKGQSAIWPCKWGSQPPDCCSRPWKHEGPAAQGQLAVETEAQMGQSATLLPAPDLLETKGQLPRASWQSKLKHTGAQMGQSATLLPAPDLLETQVQASMCMHHFG